MSFIKLQKLPISTQYSSLLLFFILATILVSRSYGKIEMLLSAKTYLGICNLSLLRQLLGNFFLKNSALCTVCKQQKAILYYCRYFDPRSHKIACILQCHLADFTQHIMLNPTQIFSICQQVSLYPIITLMLKFQLLPINGY